MFTLRSASLWLSAALLAVLTAPASAADVDKYLLEDTDALLTLNVRGLVDSPVFKKNYLPLIQKGLKEHAELQKQLQESGFDPLKDIDRIILVNSETCHRAKDEKNPQSAPFVILRGRFDPAKIHTKLEFIAKFAPKVLQIHAGASGGSIYELTIEQKSFYFAFPEKTALVGSLFKDQVQDALDKGTGKKKSQLKYKDVEKLIQKWTDGKQALWVVATGRTMLAFDTIVSRENGKKLEKLTKQTLGDNGVEEVTGGILFNDGLKTAFGIKLANEPAAKAIADALSAALADAIQKNFDDKLDDPRAAPLRELLKVLVIAGDGKYIVVQGEVAGKVFADSLK